MKRLIIAGLFTLTLGFGQLVGQVKTAEELVEIEKEVQSNWSVSSNLVSLFAGYEYRIASQTTVDILAGLGGTFGYNNRHSGIYGSSYGKGWFYIITPAFKTNLNYYYNFHKRNKKGKTTKCNSANFLRLSSLVIPGTVSWSNREGNRIVTSWNIDANWGIRRYLGANFTFELELGVGYGLSELNKGFYPSLDFTFSYHF